jgi:photosystem II stability/assembly factor-like uncharacterized protein
LNEFALIGVVVMRKSSLSLLFAALVLAMAPARAETPVAIAVETEATKLVNPEATERRVNKLKAGIAGKLARRTKFERLGKTAEWQKKWAAGTAERFDQPQEATAHFLAKRMAVGQSGIGAPDYAAALAQMQNMPVYATATGSLLQPSGSKQLSPVSNANALGSGWQALGPGNIGGRTRALLIHPTTPNVMWAGGVAGGIWKSTDGGDSWTPKADLLVNIAVNSMVLDPRNSNTIYAGTGEGYFSIDGVRGAGILKSTDGGETWAQMPSTNSSDFYFVQKIVISRGASQRIYAATRTGVFRSTDAGATWSKVLDGTTVNGCMDLAIQTDRSLANVFAACGTFTQAAIYRALDTGAPTQTWTSVHAPAGMGRTTLALAPSNQNIIYAMSASATANNFLALYRSTTSGSAGSWTTRVDNTSPTRLNRSLLSNPVYFFLTACGFGTSADLAQGWYDNTLAVDPVDPNVVWAGGIDLFRSDDGGANFGQASHWWFTEGTDPEYNHADQHTVAFHPQYNGTTNKIMYTGNDGGVHVTLDARAPVSYSPEPVSPTSPVCGNTAAGVLSWTSKNNGYQVTQFYDGAVFPDGNTYFGGTQDNGTLLGTTSAADVWSRYAGGDGGYVAVNPANTNMRWHEFTGLSIRRSSDAGATSVPFVSGITEASGNFLFITPFAQDPSDAARMWIGGASLWRTSVATAAALPAAIWSPASSFLSARVSAIAVSPLNSERVYAGTQAVTSAAASGVVWTTGASSATTAATVWASSKPRPGVNYVSWIAADPVAPGTVYATISTFNDGTGSGHVFRSTDFGATWANIDGSGATGIPDVPALTIAVDPLNNQRLYVGTDVGVFVSLNGGATWARENTGFANVSVEALKIKGRSLYAFTHGRSAFRVALDAPPSATSKTGR